MWLGLLKHIQMLAKFIMGLGTLTAVSNDRLGHPKQPILEVVRHFKMYLVL